MLALVAMVLAGCGRETDFKEAPEQVAKEQSAADAHNADTVPFAGDDETPATTAPATSTIPVVAGAERLFPADCVDQPSADAVEVHDISCSRPHHAEVTARVELGPRFGDVPPTDKQLDDVLDTDCRLAFENYVGHAPTPDLIVGVFGPTLNKWNDPALRFAVCLAGSPHEGNVLTGSVRKRD